MSLFGNINKLQAYGAGQSSYPVNGQGINGEGGIKPQQYTPKQPLTHFEEDMADFRRYLPKQNDSRELIPANNSSNKWIA